MGATVTVAQLLLEHNKQGVVTQSEDWSVSRCSELCGDFHWGEKRSSELVSPPSSS